MDSQNRRGTARVVPKIDNVFIYGVGPGPIAGALLDESFGGISIAVPKLLESGCEIEVDVAGLRHWAIIRHVVPLPSGCKLGLEWKAQALNRRLRELIAVVERETGPKSKVAEFSRILPGGLCTLWKLFEAKQWRQLFDSTERLRKESAACKIMSISAAVESLQDILQVPIRRPDEPAENVEEIREELNQLIMKCISATTDHLSIA